MRIGKFLAASFLSLASTLSIAGPYTHPVTGDLIFDEDSFIFTRGCGDFAEAIVSEEGLDLIYSALIAGGDKPSSVACYFRGTLNIPEGWFVKIYADVSVNGIHSDGTLVSLEQSLAGTTTRPAFQRFTTEDSYIIEQELIPLGVTDCKDRSVELKTVAHIISLKSDSYITLNSGSIGGQTRAWQYSLVWEEC